MLRWIKITIRNLVFRYLIYLFPEHKRTRNNDVGISMLLCHENVIMAIYALSSFMKVMKRDFPVYIVSDGSLLSEDYRLLSKYFIVIHDSDLECKRKMGKVCQYAPGFGKYYNDHFTAIYKRKFDAYLLPPFKKIIYCDSDVLFFNQAIEVSNWIENDLNTVLYIRRDRERVVKYGIPDYGYSLRYLFLNRYVNDFNLFNFNAGFLCFDKKYFPKLEFVNKIIDKLFETDIYKHRDCEEIILIYLISLLESGNIFSLPTTKYRVEITDHDHKIDERKVMSHYVFQMKEIFYFDSVKLAFKGGFFKNTAA